jgi:hypothetical protein
MKKVLIGCSVALVFLASTWVVCAAPANFSGNWTLDKSKSRDLPPQIENSESYTLVVTQDDQRLTVENKIVGGQRPDGGEPGVGGQGGGRRPGGTGGQGGGRRPDGAGGQGGGRGGFGMGMPTATYKLDGTESKVESTGGRGGAVTLKAQWKDGGKALELMTTRSINFQGNETTRTTKEHWELSDSGKTLKIKRTVDGRQGPRESTLVFSRQ